MFFHNKELSHIFNHSLKRTTQENAGYNDVLENYLKDLQESNSRIAEEIYFLEKQKEVLKLIEKEIDAYISYSNT